MKGKKDHYELIKTLLTEERWRQVLSSLVVCFFARGIYQPEVVIKALKIVGFDLTIEDLNRFGEEIHNEKYRFKIQEGFSIENQQIPKRIFETPSPSGKLNAKYIGIEGYGLQSLAGNPNAPKNTGICNLGNAVYTGMKTVDGKPLQSIAGSYKGIANATCSKLGSDAGSYDSGFTVGINGVNAIYQNPYYQASS